MTRRVLFIATIFLAGFLQGSDFVLIPALSTTLTAAAVCSQQFGICAAVSAADGRGDSRCGGGRLGAAPIGDGAGCCVSGS